MHKVKLKTYLSSFAFLLAVGCDESSITSQGTGNLPDGEYCFRNVSSNAGLTDTEELFFAVTDGIAVGEYNWLPQMKDNRIGTFEGLASGRRIDANYLFIQEGNTSAVAISITVGTDEVIIDGGPPEIGLNSTLQKISC